MQRTIHTVDHALVQKHVLKSLELERAQRDVDQYIAEANRRGLRIKYVIETHLHADLVSGHRELADRTGAEIVIGAAAGAQFPHRAVRAGDTMRACAIELR